MLILKIKDPGHSLNIPGFKEMKTPVEIDVYKKDLNVIITYLRKHGINNYELKSGDRGIGKPEQIKEETQVINKEIVTKEVIKEDIDLKNKINNIETLLIDFIKNQKNPVYYNNDGINVITNKVKKIIEEDEINFIPNIDISNLSSKGNLTQTTIISEKNDDVADSVNLLKSLNKKNRGKY